MDAANQFILDNSVAMVWGFADEADVYATSILDRMSDLEAFVPSLWPLEVANAMLVGERRNRSTPADTARFLTLLGGLPIHVDEPTSFLPTMQPTSS
jgi:hypothetical protein